MNGWSVEAGYKLRGKAITEKKVKLLERVPWNITYHNEAAVS